MVSVWLSCSCASGFFSASLSVFRSVVSISVMNCCASCSVILKSRSA